MQLILHSTPRISIEYNLINFNYCTILILVAKRKSLFDDRPAEIQELTYIIKGDINSLNQQIARLQEMSKSQRKTTNAKHLLSHSSNMVLALQAKLANMSTDFKQVLEVRTENLKQQKTRRDQVSNYSLMRKMPNFCLTIKLMYKFLLVV